MTFPPPRITTIKLDLNPKRYDPNIETIQAYIERRKEELLGNELVSDDERGAFRLRHIADTIMDEINRVLIEPGQIEFLFRTDSNSRSIAYGMRWKDK